MSRLIFPISVLALICLGHTIFPANAQSTGTGTVLQFADCMDSGWGDLAPVRGPCDLYVSSNEAGAYVYLHGNSAGEGAGEQHRILGNIFADLYIQYRGLMVHRMGARSDCWADEFGVVTLCVSGISQYYAATEFDSVPVPVSPSELLDGEAGSTGEYIPLPPNNTFLD